MQCMSILSFLAGLLIFSSFSGTVQKPPKVLVFMKTEGFHHESIPDGAEALKELSKKYSFEVDTTSSASCFTKGQLKEYAAVVFLSTSGDVFNEDQKEAFKNYIQNGGGYVGIHAASTTEYNWPWYGKLVGARFDQHPEIQEAILTTYKDVRFPVLDSLPKKWQRKDEWYNFKEIPQNVNVLATIDENSYKGGTHGDPHPLIWYHEFDGGRSFYIGLGHSSETYKDQEFLGLLWNGIKYAMGNK